MATLLTNPTTISEGAYTGGDGTGWGMSFWAKFDAEAGGGGNMQMIGAFPGGQNTHIYMNGAGYIEMRAHGYTSWIDPELMIPSTGISPKIVMESGKLYNIIYLTFPAATGSNVDFEIYVNGKLAAYSRDNNPSYYPGNASYREIGNSSGISAASLGDFAIWLTDIRPIVKEIYNGGSIRDWQLLSIKPSHYWRFGDSEGLDQVEDLGAIGGRPFVYTEEPVTFKKKFHPRRKRKTRIRFKGGDTMEIALGTDYTEEGAFQEGGVVGIKKIYNVTGTVDTNTEGSYELTYTFTDKYGNTITKTRTVIVSEPIVPPSIGDPLHWKATSEAGKEKRWWYTVINVDGSTVYLKKQTGETEISGVPITTTLQDGKAGADKYHTISNQELSLPDNLSGFTADKIEDVKHLIRDVRSTVSGPQNAAFIDSNGKLYTAGSSGRSVLGTGTHDSYNGFVHIGDGYDTTAGNVPPKIGFGLYHGAAIKADKTLLTWGYNYSGQLGSGSTNNYHGSVVADRVPTQVATDADEVRCGRYSTFYRSGTTWFSVGQKYEALQGTEDTRSFAQVTLSQGAIQDIQFVQPGTLVLLTDGQLLGFGRENLDGLFEPNQGSIDYHNGTVLATDVEKVWAAGSSTIYIKKTDGTYWAKGDCGNEGYAIPGEADYVPNFINISSRLPKSPNDVVLDIVDFYPGRTTTFVKVDTTPAVSGGEFNGEVKHIIYSCGKQSPTYVSSNFMFLPFSYYSNFTEAAITTFSVSSDKAIGFQNFPGWEVDRTKVWHISNLVMGGTYNPSTYSNGRSEAYKFTPANFAFTV